jgi:uncharacterized membrane protein YeaQ/YmgE (transglycosylase-associated protein family)
MGILIWIVLGAIAGVVAKFIMPGPQPGGIILTIVLGIVGALVGGFIASLLGIGGAGASVGALNVGSVIIAILGAILVLFIYQLVVGRRGNRRG